MLYTQNFTKQNTKQIKSGLDEYIIPTTLAIPVFISIVQM